jgi:hypothetical protein
MTQVQEYSMSSIAKFWERDNKVQFKVALPSSLVVKALGYKPEGRGFETQWGEILNLPNPFGRTRPWEFTQPLTEMSTGNIKKNVSGSKMWLVRGAGNLTTIYEPIV